MPSSKMPKRGTKMNNGVTRPFVTPKTDKRVNTYGRNTGFSATVGGASGEVSVPAPKSKAQLKTNRKMGLPDPSFKFKYSSNGTSAENRALEKKLSSYARNYYKKNSK